MSTFAKGNLSISINGSAWNGHGSREVHFSSSKFEFPETNSTKGLTLQAKPSLTGSGTTRFYCSTCKLQYTSQVQYLSHTKETLHVLRDLFSKNRDFFYTEIDNVEIIVPTSRGLVDENIKTEIKIANKSSSRILQIKEIFQLVETSEVKIESAWMVKHTKIDPGNYQIISLYARFTECGNKCFPFSIQLCAEYNTFYLLLEPVFEIAAHMDRKVLIPSRIKNTSSTLPNSYWRPPLKASQNKISDSGEKLNKPSANTYKKSEASDDIIPRHSLNESVRGLSNWSRYSKPVGTYKENERFSRAASTSNSCARSSVNDSERKADTMRHRRVFKPVGTYKGSGDSNLYPIPAYLNTFLKNGFKINSEEDLEIQFSQKIRLMLCGHKNNKSTLNNIDGLNNENYVERMHMLMWIEEYQAQKDIHSFNQKNITLITGLAARQVYGINMPGLSEGRPSILKGDMVLVNKVNSIEWYAGYVQDVQQSVFYVKIKKRYQLNFPYKEGDKVNVSFILNRRCEEMCHKVLERVSPHFLKYLIFPTRCYVCPQKIELRSFFNQSIAQNKEQVQAVRSIVQNQAYPAPYILFGPPGTGKTATVVEAITQVWTIYKPKICVCGSSNAASDVLMKRLLQYVPANKLYRFYGRSRAKSVIPEEFMSCSNIHPVTHEVDDISIDDIRKKDIIVVTPVTAGRLSKKCLLFDYLFMDEAGHTLEVEMLIPVVGLLKPTGSLILAGDPQQLGPVVRSSWAINLGYGISLLERFMKQCSLYKKDSDNLYNSKVITKLVNNYRSHHTILNIPNARFYENELKPKAPASLVSSACVWEELPTKNFPVLFHGTKGLEDRDNNSPSYFNQKEVTIVGEYVRKLIKTRFNRERVKETDIGIITPYRKQVQKIRDHLKLHNLEGVTVASVEEFQGQEKLIIIISTVRSRTELIATDYKHGLGFLRNEKRFNVAVTRAIALLIIIGNPDVLQCDPNWRALLQYCIAHKSFKGEHAEYTPSDFDVVDELAANLQALTI